MKMDETRDKTPEWIAELASKWRVPGVSEDLDRRVLHSYQTQVARRGRRRALSPWLLAPPAVFAATLVLVAILIWSPGPPGASSADPGPLPVLTESGAPGFSAVVIPFDLQGFEASVDGPVQVVEVGRQWSGSQQ